MRAMWGWALFCLGGWGCGGAPGLETSSLESEPAELSALACSPSGAERVKIVVPAGTPESPFFVVTPEGIRDVQGKAYFSVNFRDGSATLWRSQGTDASTVVVKSFSATTPARNVFSLAPLGSRLLFQVHTPETGLEPWITDGTDAGTHLVKDVTPGTESSSFSQVSVFGGAATFFNSREVMTPPRTQVELWRSDGTSGGTTLLVNFGVLATLLPQYVRTTSSHLFFLSSPDEGTALWRTNGTTGGTAFVKRLDAGEVRVVDVNVTEDGATGLFTLQDGPNTEVWKSNGTAAGTVRLETFGRAMRMSGSLGTSVYLTSADPVTQRMGLYRVALAGGGKTTITYLANPFASQPDALPYLQQFTRSGGKLYFAVAIGTSGPTARVVRLWVTDGTAANTRQLPSELSVSGDFNSDVYPLAGGGVIFAGADAPGNFTNPWVTRGTAATTAELTTEPPVLTSSPWAFSRVGNLIYFAARDEETFRYQLWAVPANVTCTP
ncbi:hypothetical protein ACN469_42055 [Corallococcus terminator]